MYTIVHAIAKHALQTQAGQAAQVFLGRLLQGHHRRRRRYLRLHRGHRHASMVGFKDTPDHPQRLSKDMHKGSSGASFGKSLGRALTRGRDRVKKALGSESKPAVRASEVARVTENQVKSMPREALEALVLGKIAERKPITPADVKRAHEGALQGDDETASSAGSSTDLLNRKWPPSCAGFSDAQKRELEDDFIHFDLNGDGKITLDEFIKVMLRKIKAHEDIEEPQIIAMFQEMNTSGSGTVNFTEFADSWAHDEHMHDELSWHAHALSQRNSEVPQKV